MNKSFILNNGKYIKFTPKTYDYVLIEPKMTSDISNGYKVNGTLASSSNGLWKAFDGDSINTYYSTSDVTSNASIILELPTAKVISKYSIVQYSSGVYIKSWSLHGSNDSAIWTLLNSANATTFSEASLIIDFKNDTPYKFYKLQVADSSASSVFIKEINYYEKVIKTEEGNVIIGDALPTVDQFVANGMSELSILDRKSKVQLTTMNDDSNNGSGETLENGKVFKKRVDLNKYFDILSISIK